MKKNVWNLSLVTISILIICLLAQMAWAAGTKAISCTPTCGTCTPNLTGDWHYVISPSVGDFSAYDMHITRSGSKITGHNGTHTLIGNLDGNSIDVTLAVDGEEIEGWALHAEGNVIGKSKFVAVYHDSEGGTGSLTGSKQ